MANEYSADVPKGFNVPKQARLDSITGIQNEITLKDLGAGNNLAFKYYEGLKTSVTLLFNKSVIIKFLLSDSVA